MSCTYPIARSSESVTEFPSHLIGEVDREIAHNNPSDGVVDRNHKSIELVYDIAHFYAVVDQPDKQRQNHKCVDEQLDNLRSLLNFLD